MNQTENKTGINAWASLVRVAGVALDLGASALGHYSSSFRVDSFENPLTGLNTARDKTTHARVKPVVPLTDHDCSNMFRGNIFARRVCSALVTLSLRQGIRLTHPDASDEGAEGASEDAKRLRAALKRMGVLQTVSEAATWGRAYGRGAVLCGIEGAGEQDTPYDWETMPGRLRFLVPLEKQDFVADRMDDVTGMPITWRLNLPGNHSNVRNLIVHDSRLIMFGGELTSLRDRISNGFADDSVLLVAFEGLRDLDTIWRSTVHLVSDASQSIFSVKGFFDMMTSGNVEPLLTRLSVMDMARSTVRGVVMDADDEKFERSTTNFSGLPDTLQHAFQYVAATANMPVTELMGMSPAGLNATGESDTRSWYAKGESYQTDVLADPVEKLVNLVARSIDLETGWTIKFPSLWTMTPKEEAEHRKLVAETDKLEIDGQVLLPEEVAAHRHSGLEDAWFTPVPIDLEARAALIQQQMAEMLRGAEGEAATAAPGVEEAAPATEPTPATSEPLVDPLNPEGTTNA